MKADVCNFAGDSNLYTSRFELNDVLIRLEHNRNVLLKGFRDHDIKSKEVPFVSQGV